MKQNLEWLRHRLRRDGLCSHAMILMAYAWIWYEPQWPYHDILVAYADFIDDAPERVQSGLCYQLLAAGREIGPEEYILALKMEAESENGILIEQGSGTCALGTDPGEPIGHARSAGHRAPDQ